MPPERVDKNHYFEANYDTKGRFCSYWHQINEILIDSSFANVLEIGVGNGFVSRYLMERSINVITLDINYDLRPQVTGSILYLPFVNDAFDVVLCCQVLEHLPYGVFIDALNELYRITSKKVILSLPDHTPAYRFNIELPRIKPIKLLLKHPFPRPIPHKHDGVHYWIIGRSGYPLKRILNDIQYSGFQIIKTYRVYEFYSHRFFIIEK